MRAPLSFINSPILDSLENLGALNGTALYEIKPFRDWKDSKWRNKVFTMRLCNSGEGVDVLEELSKVGDMAKGQLTKFHLLARSIFTIDGAPPVSTSDLERFNRDNNFQYDQKDYLLLWFRNTEQVVLDRLDAIYASLQQKQVRQLNGVYACDVCNMEFNSPPEGSKKLLYAAAEIVCNQCMAVVDQSLCDFEDEDVKTTFEEPKEEIPSRKEHKCTLCKEEFDSFEELNQHLPECDSEIPS